MTWSRCAVFLQNKVCDRISSTIAGILADAFQFSEDDLHRRRAESVNNVKKTNGRISLEQRVREAWEEDDEWQD